MPPRPTAPTSTSTSRSRSAPRISSVLPMATTTAQPVPRQKSQKLNNETAISSSTTESVPNVDEISIELKQILDHCKSAKTKNEINALKQKLIQLKDKITQNKRNILNFSLFQYQSSDG